MMVSIDENSGTTGVGEEVGSEFATIKKTCYKQIKVLKEGE
jgi:hypothetical protein